MLCLAAGETGGSPASLSPCRRVDSSPRIKVLLLSPAGHARAGAVAARQTFASFAPSPAPWGLLPFAASSGDAQTSAGQGTQHPALSRAWPRQLQRCFQSQLLCKAKRKSGAGSSLQHRAPSDRALVPPLASAVLWQPALQDTGCIGTLTLEGNRQLRQSCIFLPGPQQAEGLQGELQGGDASLRCLLGFSWVLAWRGRMWQDWALTDSCVLLGQDMAMQRHSERASSGM